MSRRDVKREIALEGHLRFESDGAAFDITAKGAEVRVEARGLRTIRWTPRLLFSSAMLALRLRRRIGKAGLRLKFARKSDET